MTSGRAEARGHRWSTFDSPDGHFWACSCGELSEPLYTSPAAAGDAAESHAREATAVRG